MGGGALAPGAAIGMYSRAMPTHSESRRVPYDADLMFSVVAEVERYPEFLPWVTGLKVLSREKNAGKEIVVAEMTVGFAALRERYTSRILLDPRARTIDVTQAEGVFRHLDTRWRFTPEGAANKSCRIDFFIEYAFRSRLLNLVAGTAFHQVAGQMVRAYEARARALSEQSPH
ncbi:MAG TPA: type II toxin-antitoxin system RatA family toxin [Rhizomicrobium sp.]|jgi:coenzyme Q-binding protein COQ10